MNATPVHSGAEPPQAEPRQPIKLPKHLADLQPEVDAALAAGKKVVVGEKSVSIYN